LNGLTSAPIAQGRTAEIHLWDDQHILKLYRDWCPAHWVDDEARIAGAIYEAGIPSPAAGEIVEVNGRRGLIYERIIGVSMLRDMNARPWLFLKHARSLAELQVQINRLSITGLPSYKEQLHHSIRATPHLSEHLQNQALAILDALPDGKNVCHGDFHPGNVIVTKNGPIVIDWMTARAGTPWADVARTSLLLSIGANAAREQVHPFIRTMIRLYYRVYLNQYRMLIPDTENELKRWMPVIAAARLNENILPEREALINMAKEGVRG